MRILLTNDDGVRAPGLKVLEKIAREFSDDVWTVAPTEEQSGSGHSLTLTRPLRLRKLGELRKHYHKEVEKRLVAELPKDLVNMPVNEIEKILQDA